MKGTDALRVSLGYGRMPSRAAPLLIVTFVLAVAGSAPALACVVGTGTGGSCTESALTACLPGGGSFDGTVTFNCGGAATITVTSTKTISADTSLDGGGLITLSVGGMVWMTTPIFTVNASGVTLTLDNVTLSGVNHASSGGAIYNTGGTVTVTNSTFSGNGAAGDGGAIYNTGGTVTVTNSTFSSGNNASHGGAIYNTGGTVTVTNSTFSSNSASYGGAINNTGGTVTVTNSTFSGNLAYGGGGGIANYGGTLTVTNSTFSGNSAGGGGAAIVNDTGTVTLNNTIVANSVYGANCFGTAITDGGHNLRWPSTDTSCVGDLGDPKLAPLADNGGLTQTMAIESASAAINAGDNTVCAAPLVNNLDQRGFVRPGTGATNCSIGAYEYNSPSSPTVPTLSTWGIIGFSGLAFAFVLWGAGRSRWRSPWDADC